MSSNIIILVGAITSATALLKKLNKRFGIPARIVHTPSELGGRGCSYSLKTERKYLPKIMEAINATGIKTRGIYFIEISNGKEVYHALS